MRKRSYQNRRRQGPRKKITVCGKVIKNARGFAFVVPDPPINTIRGDIFLSVEEAASLINGDIVKVEVFTHPRDKKHNGQLLSVLQHSLKTIVGTFRADPQPAVEILGKGMELTIPLKPFSQTLTPGSAILIKLLYSKKLHEKPKGELISVLADSMNSTTDIPYIVSKHKIRTDFPKECTKEAKKIPQRVEKKDIKNRKDLRHLSFVTIDGATAKDFDDAVFGKKTGNGTYTLWVAIADVSYYVKLNSSIDKEALSRGTSIYFPHTAIPMLPEKLSNGICSLNPKVDRLVVVCEIELNDQGDKKKCTFYNGVIHSQKRLTYEEAQDFFAHKNKTPLPKQIKESLRCLFSIYKILQKNRTQKGYIDLNIAETEMKLSPKGKVLELNAAQRLDAHRLIEECMIAANEAVAHFLTKNKVPIIFRTHETPELTAVKTFLTVAKSLGIPLPSKTSTVTQKTYQKILLLIEKHPSKKVLNFLLLRSMKQASYTTENLGHFALASEFYTHFTSPIRRYSDLVVHRTLKAFLNKNKERVYLPQKLSDIAQHCSNRERIAISAERELIRMKQVRFARKYLGKVYMGTVIGSNKKGLFVEINKLLIEGFVAIEKIGYGYKYNDKHMLFYSRKSGKKICLGDKIKVQIAQTNLQLLQIDLEPIKTATKKKKKRTPKHLKRSQTESKPHHHRRKGKRASK